MKELPFVLDDTLKCYMYNAFFGGILSAYENMEGWIVEHYIQLCYTGNKYVLNSDEQEAQITFYGGWTEPMQLFEYNTYNLNDVDLQNIDELFRREISRGYYVFTYIDEALIYNCKDNAHDVIIIGYDEESECFIIVGYYDNRYKKIEISYEILKNAFVEGVKIGALSKNFIGAEYIKTARPKFDINSTYKIRIERLITGCEEYVNSINTGLKNANGNHNHFMYEGKGSVWGINVYECIVEHINKCIEKDFSLDYRKIHIIYEYRLMMERRLRYLEQLFMPDFSALIKKNEEMLLLSNNMRFIAMKYKITHQKELLISIKKRIIEIREDDVVFTKQFIEHLRKLVEMRMI